MPGDMVIPGELLIRVREPWWPGAGACAARPLWGKDAAPHVPWVALGHNQPHTFQFLPREDLKQPGRSQADLEREAVQALERRNPRWVPWTVKLGLFQKLNMIAHGDDYFAAEQIVNARFLREAHRQLGSSKLLAAVPRAGALMVTNAVQAADKISAFVMLACEQYNSADAPPISPLSFHVTDGRIVGVIEDAAPFARSWDAEESDGEDDDAEDEDAEGTYVSRLCLTDDTGAQTPVIIAVDSDFDRLAQALIEQLAATATEYAARPEWTGEIQVSIPADTPEIDEKLPRLRAHLQGLASELLQSAGKNPKVTVKVGPKAGLQD